MQNPSPYRDRSPVVNDYVLTTRNVRGERDQTVHRFRNKTHALQSAIAWSIADPMAHVQLEVREVFSH